MTDRGESREAFMARVRGALGRGVTGAPDGPPPAVDEGLVRLAGAGDDLPAMFTERAQAVGMFVHRVTRDAAVAVLRQLLADRGSTRLACHAGATGAALGLPAALGDGFELATGDGATMDAFYDTDSGIGDVHAALAETGTLVVCSGPTHPRGTSILPPHHVALVRASDIVPDMLDYWAQMAGIPGTDLPSSQVFITGPSKTADIEGVLVTGVHGPDRVDIVLIEDL